VDPKGRKNTDLERKLGWLEESSLTQDPARFMESKSSPLMPILAAKKSQIKCDSIPIHLLIWFHENPLGYAPKEPRD
jgi:hypothetical protein